MCPIPTETSRLSGHAAALARESDDLAAGSTADEPLLTPVLVSLIAVNVAFSFAFSTFFLLPKFLVKELGATATDVGAVTGAYGVTMVLGLPLVARLLDGPHRRTVLIAGCGLMGLSAFGFIAVDAVYPAVILLRGAQGLALSMVHNAASAIAADLAPRGRLAQVLGLYAGSGMLMTAIAPAIAEVLAERVGYGPVFVGAGVASCAACLLALRVRDRRHAAVRAGGMWTLLFSRRALGLMVVFGAAGLGFGVMFTFTVPFALSLGIADIRGFFLAFALAAVSVRLGLGAMVDRIGPGRVSVFSLMGYGAVIAAMSLLQPGRLELLGGILGLVHGLFIPAFMAHAVSAAERGDSGKILTLLNGAFNLGNCSVALLGPLAERYGYPPVFASVGLFILAVPFGMLRQLRR